MRDQKSDSRGPDGRSTPPESSYRVGLQRGHSDAVGSSALLLARAGRSRSGGLPVGLVPGMDPEKDLAGNEVAVCAGQRPAVRPAVG